VNSRVTVNETLLKQAMQVTHLENSEELVEKALLLLIQRYKSQTLVEFFQQSPLVGVDLDLERAQDIGRDIDL